MNGAMPKRLLTIGLNFDYWAKSLKKALDDITAGTFQTK